MSFNFRYRHLLTITCSKPRTEKQISISLTLSELETIFLQNGAKSHCTQYLYTGYLYNNIPKTTGAVLKAKVDLTLHYVLFMSLINNYFYSRYFKHYVLTTSCNS